MAVNLIAVGNSSIDNIITPCRTLYPHVCGGNCFHSGIAASIMSDNVALLTSVPSNFPKKYLDSFQNMGIDTSCVRIVDAEVNFEELFVYEENGDRLDNLFLDKCFEFKTTDLSDVDIALITSQSVKEQYTYANFRNDFAVDIQSLNPVWNIESVHLAPTKFESHYSFLMHGFPFITLDPGSYIKDLQYDEIIDIVKKVSFFMPSKKELSWILPELDIFDAMKKIVNDSGISMVCKNGKKGSVAYDAGSKEFYQIGIYPSVRNDLTGAGDSFCGSFNATYVQGNYSMLDSVRIATVVAGK
ncbi:MAG: carbohydrate kinase family protein, partial [Spirochaetales bacterium]